ncbi:xylulokinase [Oceaniglobus roseus]|uniref:xylulokinase n=1 Tax=Oceaniglobus roseus TaxID=1737570 RepID=UPI000C7F653F|nr:xylulokinase [Kandeliimicrobium roseum]
MFLGLDVGTSAVKAVLVSEEGVLRAQSSVPLTLQTPRAHWCEQDPAAWWAAVVAACRELAAAHPALWAAVKGIGLSGQMHGAVLLDRAGAVIRPAILWNDSRAHAECEAMAEADPTLGETGGAPALPGLTAPKLLWLKTHEPEAFGRIAHMLLPKDYIGLRLHGRHVTDHSDAAGTLLYDQAARAWSAPLCALAGAEAGGLPEIRESAGEAGRLTGGAAAELGLAPGLPVTAGAGDTAVGAVGIGAVAAGDAVLSVGTSGQLFVPTADYRPAPGSVVHSFAHAVPGLWYQMAAMLNGARPMAWFSETAGVGVGDLLAEAAEAREAPLFLPYLTGERTPHGDPHIRGGFFGIGTNTTRGQMMRGVVQGVAFSFADGAEALAAGGTRPRSFLAVGGGTRSDLLMQTISDLLEVEIARAAGAAAGPAFGAARLAAVMTGAASWGDLAVRPGIERSFRPDASRKAFLSEKLAAFRQLYAALKGLRVPQAAATSSGGSLAPVMKATASDIV